MVQRFGVILFIVLLTTGVWGGDNFPALYQAENFRLSSLEQVQTRWQDINPEFSHEWVELDEVEYQGQTYSGYTLTTDGVKNNVRYIQELTYIDFLPGLIKLVYVEARDCIMGEAINSQGEWESDWRCQSFGMPLSGYSDIFILANADVDIASLSQLWGKEIVPLAPSTTNQLASGARSLGDLRSFILSRGGSWEMNDAQWNGPIANPLNDPVPAVLIEVVSAVDDVFTARQSFLYVMENDLLRLKEIDGVICRYVERMEKDICDPLYQPTPGTPFPMELVNSLELTGESLSDESNESDVSVFQCGNIPQNLNLVLQYHFERSIFSVNDIHEYRKIFKKLAFIADPEDLLLSSETTERYNSATQEPYVYDEMLNAFMSEINKGNRGDCSMLLPYIDELREEVLVQTSQVTSLFNLLKDNDFRLSPIQRLNLTETQQKVLRRIQANPLVGYESTASVDVLSGQLKRYLMKSLERLSSPEWTITAAIASQDAYSMVFEDDQQTQATLNGQASGLYFGVVIETGISGFHYFDKVHPRVAEMFGINVGDKIVSINGENANNISYNALDQLLLDKQTPIQLTVEKNGIQEDLTLRATEIDPLDSYYELSVLRRGSNDVLLIKLNSFEEGLAAKVRDEVRQISQSETISGYILDLRGNGGGNTYEAMRVLSWFVRDTSVALYTMGSRFSNDIRSFSADPEFFLDDEKPLLVFVDEKTKSAAEIVTGSLKDLGRSLTIGTRTFGKFVNQYYSPIELSNGMDLGLLVTSLEFYSPLGISRNSKGVQPDIELTAPLAEPFADGNSPGRDLDLSTYEEPIKVYSVDWAIEELNYIELLVQEESTDSFDVALMLFN